MQKTYGDRVILHFKQSNIPYAYMNEFICREARTCSLPECLMVDCKTILETRKWALFYMKEGKIDWLKNALKKEKCPVTDKKFGEMFSISVSDRMGKQYLPWGKDWHWTYEDALVTIHHDDNIVLDIEYVIQTMEGDSVIAVINTNHLSLEGSSHWAVHTRNDKDNTRNAVEMLDWKHLEDVKIPSKIWDIIDSRRSTSHSEGDANPSDERTTMSGQGEE